MAISWSGLAESEARAEDAPSYRPLGQATPVSVCDCVSLRLRPFRRTPMENGVRFKSHSVKAHGDCAMPGER